MVLMVEDYGAEIAYPEHRYLHLKRLGRQRLGRSTPTSSYTCEV